MYQRQSSSKGQDLEHTVDITLEEAYHGTTRTLIKDDGERITAKIPQGSKTGTKVRLRGKGGPGPTGPGDIYLKIKVTRSSDFVRSGDNLKANVPLDLLTAVLGGKVSVPTLSGPVKLTIPAGTQGGMTFRLKGKGMPHLRDSGVHGDLLATVQIRVPETLNEDERRLYENLVELAKKRQ
jgi:curved DNA-binding protein